MYSQEVIEKFSKHNENDVLTLVLENYYQHDKRHIYKIKPLPNRPKSLIGQNGLYLIQNLLFRSKALIEGWINSVNSQNVICGAMLTRAHYETTGTMALLLKKLRSFYNGNINEENLDEAIHRLSLGVRIGMEKVTPPQPYNVLTLIDTIDELFTAMGGTEKKGFRDAYEFLSEICHPNQYGLTVGTEINKVSVVRFSKDFSISENHFCVFGYMTITTSMFITFYDEARNLLFSNEELPIILDQ